MQHTSFTALHRRSSKIPRLSQFALPIVFCLTVVTLATCGKDSPTKPAPPTSPPVQPVTPDEPDEPAYSVFRREGSTNIVSWTPSPSATYYNLYESRLFPEEFFATELASNITGTSYKHTDTSDILDYFYWIQACNEHGCSDLYWVGPPVLLRIAVIDRDEGSLTIRLSSRGISTHYPLFRSDVAFGGFSEIEEKIESTETVVTYVDDELTDDTTLYYKAKACNNNGCSEFTDVTGGITEVAGPVEVPPPPVGVVAREINIFLGPNDGRVSWSATPRATYYVINEDGQYEGVCHGFCVTACFM